MLSALEFLLVCILGYGKDIWIQYFEVVVWFCNHKAVNTLYSLNWYLNDLFCVFFGKLQQSFSPESCKEVDMYVRYNIESFGRCLFWYFP